MRNTASTVISIIVIVLIIIGLVYWSRSKNMSETPVPTESPMASSTAFSITSSAFTEGGSIPTVYTCEGSNTNPPLMFSNVPTSTVSLALTMYDPDVPKQVRPEGFFDHWVLFNIPATTTEIAASSTAGIAGSNGRNVRAYAGPCPPAEYEPREHRYIFTLYALDSMLNLQAGATRAQVEQAIVGHVVGQVQLMGRYQKIATSTATTTPR